MKVLSAASFSVVTRHAEVTMGEPMTVTSWRKTLATAKCGDTSPLTCFASVPAASLGRTLLTSEIGSSLCQPASSTTVAAAHFVRIFAIRSNVEASNPSGAAGSSAGSSLPWALGHWSLSDSKLTAGLVVVLGSSDPEVQAAHIIATARTSAKSLRIGPVSVISSCTDGATY